MTPAAPIMHNESSTRMLTHAFQHRRISAPLHPKTEAATTPVHSVDGYSALLECVKSYRPSHSILEFRSSFQHISPTELPLLH